MSEGHDLSKNSTESRRLTTVEYWDGGYSESADHTPLVLNGYRDTPARRIVEAVESVNISGRKVLEIGAGNSAFLCYLARKYASTGATFTGLDYSPHGCDLLARRAALEGVDVTVVHCDMFHATDDLSRRFDVVYSVGVAEHFHSLADVLRAMQRFVAPGGVLLTIVPNMAGVLGSLTRRFSYSVYEKHIPHDLRSLLQAHDQVGMQVDQSGYLCSTNFGVLSSCFSGPGSRGWRVYLWLSRLSKVVWALENRLGEFPKSGFLSPYLYAIARVP